MVRNLRYVFIGIVVCLGVILATKNSYAASFQSASDLISTSRPSASAPLNADQAAAAASVTTVDNGSIYLASDSANFAPDTGETGNYGVNVATMSAQIAGSPTTRQITFTGTISNAHHKGDAVYVPITAMHKVQIKINTALVSGNHLIIIFPGGGSNIASPSATTFSFNNLASGQIAINGFTCSAWTISAPSIDCTLSSSLASGATATFLIGCTAQASGNCTTQNPLVINPTKSAANSCNTNSTTCTADSWKLIVKSQIGGIDQDVSSVRIGTIESVQVQANVEPSLTFTITGLADATNLNTQNSNCGADILNTGVSSTATNVNLGTLANGVINKAAQELSVSTNGSSGYVITATSSGRFIDAPLGFWLPDANGGNGLTANDTPVPAVFGASGTPDYGIHACGTNVTAQWAGSSATAFSSGAKYSNPWNTSGNFFYNTLTSATGAVSADKTEVEYAATISGTTPAGIYTNVLTYVATATF